MVRLSLPPRILKSHMGEEGEVARTQEEGNRWQQSKKSAPGEEVQRKYCQRSLRGGRTHIQWGRLGEPSQRR